MYGLDGACCGRAQIAPCVQIQVKPLDYVSGRSQERDEDSTDVATVARDEDSHLLPPDVALEQSGDNFRQLDRSRICPDTCQHITPGRQEEAHRGASYQNHSLVVQVTVKRRKLITVRDLRLPFDRRF
jgi:hypothetical protein